MLIFNYKTFEKYDLFNKENSKLKSLSNGSKTKRRKIKEKLIGIVKTKIQLSISIKNGRKLIFVNKGDVKFLENSQITKENFVLFEPNIEIMF